MDSSRNSSTEKKRKSLNGLRESQDEFVNDDERSTKAIRAPRRPCNTSSKEDDHECDLPSPLLPRTAERRKVKSRKVYADQCSFLEEDSKASDDEGVARLKRDSDYNDSDYEYERDLDEDSPM